MQFTTLNQIINKFEQIAETHAQINGFGFGESFEISASEQEKYPLLWVNVLASNITDRTLELRIGYMVIDIVADDNFNEKDTLSDTLSIAQDVFALISSPANQDSFEVSNQLTLTPMFEALPDKVNGWLCETAINIAYTANRCQVPTK